MKTCSTCKFYSNVEQQCRKALVTAIVVMAPQGQGQVIAGFPKVPPGWWCGAHKLSPGELS